MTKKAFTLFEVLSVVALLSLMMNATALFFVEGRKRCGVAMTHIEMHRHVQALRQPWRELVARASGPIGINPDGSLRIGEGKARAEGRRLILIGAGCRREFLLPAGTEFRFEKQKCPDGTLCVTLNVIGKQGFRNRIVACRRSESHAGRETLAVADAPLLYAFLP